MNNAKTKNRIASFHLQTRREMEWKQTGWNGNENRKRKQAQSIKLLK